MGFWRSEKWEKKRVKSHYQIADRASLRVLTLIELVGFELYNALHWLIKSIRGANPTEFQ